MGELIYEIAGGLRTRAKVEGRDSRGGSSAKVLRADERFKLKQKQSDGSTIERECRSN